MPRPGAAGPLRPPLLLGLVVRAAALRCTKWRAGVLNKFLDGVSVRLVNGILEHELPKTYGHCADAADPSLQPCMDNRHFPIKRSGPDYWVGSSYVTDLEGVKVRDAYLTCGGEGGEHWYANLNAHAARFAVDVRAHVDLPDFSVDAPCASGQPCLLDERDLDMHVAGRLRCYNSSHFYLELDPTDGFVIDGQLAVSLPAGIHVDVTHEVVQAIQKGVSRHIIRCPPHLRLLCSHICSGAQHPPLPEPTPTLPPDHCSLDTGSTCRFWGCPGWHGPTSCTAGRCLCQLGSCAVDGICQACPLATNGSCGLFSSCPTSLGLARCEAGTCHCSRGACAKAGRCLGLCPKDTGETCFLFRCSSWHGPTSCQGRRCVCAGGHCATPDGRCLVSPAQLEDSQDSKLPQRQDALAAAGAAAMGLSVLAHFAWRCCWRWRPERAGYAALAGGPGPR